MSGSHPSRWITFLVFGALTAFGCVGTTDTGGQGETGSLSVDLVLADGIVIDEVGWQITGNGMDMSGDVDVSAPGSTASVEVFGLPPGETDYTVTLTATSNDEKVTCEGSAPFNVEVGQSTDVMVMLNCKKPRTLGGVRVNGKFNICTQLTKVVVSPLQTSVGNDISISAQAFDEEGDAIHYIWSGDGGSIADPSAASTTYTCQDVGDHTVTIMVTDNDVYCRMATWTVPVTCVPGDVIDLCEDVECPPDGNQCTEAACEPSSGECVSSNLDDGTLCDVIGVGDGICSNGQCVEIDLCEGVDCDDDNECTADACNPADGTCENTNVDNGTPCADETGMCVDGACMISDLCEGVVCDDTGNECTVAMCNGGAGACSAGICIDNNPCQGVDCTSDNDCVQDGTCDPVDGLCDPGDPQPADTACDLTGTDDGFCDGVGTCVECNDGAQCPDDGNECTAETCTSNACSTSPVADGTMCDNDMGVCDQGVCVPANLCEGKDCSDGNECTQDLCDPATGDCSNPPVADGATCICPVCGADGLCMMGVCVDPCDGVDCSDGNECTADLCNLGVCSNPNLGPGAACSQNGGNVCDGAGACVECINDMQCDVEFNETCVDNTCIAVAQACGSQQGVVQVGCTNSLTDAQSPFPFTLSVDVPEAIIGGGAFSATLGGIGVFPQFFLDAAQGAVPGGVKLAELVNFVSTVQVRSGATGPDVPLGLDVAALDPGPLRFCNFPPDQTCTANGDCLGGVCNPPKLFQEVPTLDGVPNSPGGCSNDNGTGPGTQLPPDCDCSGCTALGTTEDGQCTTNGYCVTGSILVDFEPAIGTYTAGPASDGAVLWGWSNVANLCPGATCTEDWMIDGCLDIPPPGASRPTFLAPTAPIGIRVTVPGLNIPIQCSMGNDGGECEAANVGTGVGCLTDADCGTGETCVGVGVDDDIICPTPDSDLISCPIN